MKGVSACGRTTGPNAEGLAEGLVVCRGWGFSPADATASGFINGILVERAVLLIFGGEMFFRAGGFTMESW